MANDAVEWLATVSRHCRKLIELAGLAIRDAGEYDSKAARAALKEALTVHKEALFAALPQDFPASRRGDLARHIGFCEPNDWYDIVLFDVPDLLAKAEAYAVEMPGGRTSGIEEYIHARFRPRLELAMRVENPDFHALILACSVDLATLFQRKSGANDDSDGEIGRVLNRDNPVLIVPHKLETETERNIQRGAMLLMQGWRAFIRNPHAHGERPTDREYMVHALMLMSLLARILDGAAPTNPKGEASSAA
ncbi:MAG TPA: TIGR02391 family protein [Allosphingosinicella sp.]|nr:TIGR02391 family protein [Allosphingosinicella sp.]